MKICKLMVLLPIVWSVGSGTFWKVTAYEVGVEWVNDYGFLYYDSDEADEWGGFIWLSDLEHSDDRAVGFYNKLSADGWTKNSIMGMTWLGKKTSKRVAWVDTTI